MCVAASGRGSSGLRASDMQMIGPRTKISHALLTCQEFGHDGEAIGVREHSVHEFFANAVCSEPATRERDINYISL